MKSDEKTIKWCLKQNKGIRLEKPNNNICDEYLKKARSSLNMLNAAIERNEVDWIATTAYYARYFALYALLQKCGIKSEIHDCSISAMNYLFIEENIIEERFYDDLCLAKELRIDVQYYVATELDENKLKADAENAADFVLRMEEAAENLTNEQIEQVRKKIASL